MPSNVVSAVTALVAKGPSAAPYPCQPCVLSNMVGYQGATASAWRKHLGRRWGLRAAMFGGRWPSYTHAQYKVLCGLAPGEVTAQGQVRALAVHGQAAKRQGKPVPTPLYKVGAAARTGAKQAKRQAKQAQATEATAQATPVPDGTAQAS